MHTLSHTTARWRLNAMSPTLMPATTILATCENTILIVEYAVDSRRSGVSVAQATLDAGRIRFRPIIMTALAFVFGVMPMLFATGANARSRISIGSTVAEGMANNAIVGTLFGPNFWELLKRFGEKHIARLSGSADAVTTCMAVQPSNGDDVDRSPSTGNQA